MNNPIAKIEDLIVSFNKAVRNPENFDDSGRINWDFVDADIHLDAGEVDKSVPEEWYELFDKLAEAHLKDVAGH